MSSHDPRDELPEGYRHALCQPLTQRVMIFGLPALSWGLVGFAILQIMNFRIWSLLLPLALSVLLLRWAYSSDPWAPGAWIEHARDVITKTTRLDV